MIATFDDGTTEDVTAETHLASDPVDVVAIAGSTVVGEETGTATITADYQGETDSVEMTVAADEQPPSDPELGSLSLSVDETTISEGSATSAMVIATFDDGTAENVTDGRVSRATAPTSSPSTVRCSSPRVPAWRR
ncbi:hypothetical protein D8S78_21770 [Natrialba swarupiae]|nr:hypothetical protein [Natrialba swarupiae]